MWRSHCKDKHAYPCPGFSDMEGIHAEDVLFMMLQGQDLEKAVPTDGKNLVSKETGLGST